MHFLKRAWRGEEELAKVFWLYGFAGLTLVLCIATGGLWLLKYNNTVYAGVIRPILIVIQTGLSYMGYGCAMEVCGKDRLTIYKKFRRDYMILA